MYLEDYLILVLWPIVLEYADINLFNCKTHVEFANILLKNGSDPNSNKNGHSALLSTSFNKYWELAKLLLKYGADPKYGTHYCNYPLHYASKYGQLDYINQLLNKGAYVDRMNHFKMTPLMVASTRKNNAKCIKLLLNKGADVDAKNIYDQTALLLSACYSQWENMKVLIPHVCNLNPTTRFGSTPIHYAATHGKLECVELLLKYGADKNITGKYYNTPLDCARENGHLDCVMLIYCYSGYMIRSDI